MSWKDKRKESFKTSERPALNESRVYCKEQDGVLSFITYQKNDNGEGGENVSIGNEMQGILLGTARAYESFDRNFGSKGGTYRTGYVFDKNNCAVFDPTGKRVFVGGQDVAKEFMHNETGAAPRNYQVLFVLTGDGIYAVYTNMVIAIDQTKRYRKNLQLNFIDLKVEEYSSESDITKDGKKILGKFVDKNKPKFANISVGEPITDDFVELTDYETMQDLFNSFVEYYSHAVIKEEADDTTELPAGLRDVDPIIQAATDKFNKGKDVVPESDDDLPF